METTRIASIGGVELERMYARAMNYATLPDMSSEVRRQHVTDALRYRTELVRRAATGDVRYARYAAAADRVAA